MNLRPANNPAYEKIIIKKIIEEIPGVKTFILQPPKKINYKAGQFLTFVFEDLQGEERRSYSIASTPFLNEPLTITLKRVVNGKYSRPLIDTAKPGDVLVTTGAAGQFILPENMDACQQFFFFAAGIGITPVYSLIKTILYQYPSKEVVLIYSNSSVQQSVFYEELINLQSKFPRQFKLEFLFSSSRDLSRARLSKWLLPQVLQAYHHPKKSQQLFYTCGPFPYMRMVMLSLIEAGYQQEQIKKENFDTTRPAPKRTPPDKEAHEVFIQLKENKFRFVSKYPKTILQAAKDNNILLPYSCETGRCGSCMMQCTKGKVWMSYNEVLTDKDIEAGKVLTCVGYPILGDIELEEK